MIKKHISIAVMPLLIATILVLISCGAKDAPAADVIPPTETTAAGIETADTELTDGLPDADMNGFELTFNSYDGTKYWWSLNKIDVEALDGTGVNDSIYNRNRMIEQRYNAVIKETKVPSVEESLIKDVMAGAADYEIAMVSDQRINSCLTQGVLLMWNDMPGCNLDNPWWNADANRVFRIGGMQYAAVGDFNLSMYSKSYLVYFNKDLYGTLNPVSGLYQLVLDGEWTYERYYSLMGQYLRDLDGNGVYDESDQYGLAGMPRVMYQILLTGAGVKYVDLNNEGNPYFSVPEDERAIGIMQKIADDFGKTKSYFSTSDSAIYMQMFSGSQVVFLADTMWDTEKYRSYEINIGMLPAPKWDESQNDYRSITVGGVVSALPKTLPESDYENVGILLEALAFASKNDTLPEYKEVVLKGKYANDTESADMIDIIFSGQAYDLGVSVWDIRGTYMTNIFETANPDVVSTTERLKNQITGQIDASVAEALKNAGL